MKTIKVASFMALDLAIFTKKIVKKTSIFSIKAFALGFLSIAGILYTDILIHQDIYTKNHINLSSIFAKEDNFEIDSSLNKSFHGYYLEEKKI